MLDNRHPVAPQAGEEPDAAKFLAKRHYRRIAIWTVVPILVLCLIAALLAKLNPLHFAEAQAATVNSRQLHTWWQAGSVKNASGPIEAKQVRQSPYYSTRVASAASPDILYDTFTYVSIPRNGSATTYSDTDGAEFATKAGLSMSWSTFEYSSAVNVDVSLNTGQKITSADQVTIRPASAKLSKRLINPTTIRITVPFKPEGYRFSVEFDPQLYTAYDKGGTLVESSKSTKAVHTEPRNAMLVFAQPMPAAGNTGDVVPTPSSGKIYKPRQGEVTNLDDVDADIIYFEPGTYSMGSSYRAELNPRVRWVYLAPGAYVKGALKFSGQSQQYKITGYGVLSGEQYVYEADTANGYKHRAPTSSNCHGTCVKMLQFESSGNVSQSLDLQGITVANPPYHSFVVYGDESTFKMRVSNYQQVGGWYWQTDGIELYDGSSMHDTFFHSNDDVLKMYHSNVSVTNTVVWKNENGPVIQWGWSPRNIEKVTVSNTDVIHNLMHWDNNNTCVLNASSHWEGNETNRADPSMTVKDMTFDNLNVEGMTNCAIRVFALQDTRNIEIRNLHIDSWNNMDIASQYSKFTAFTDGFGTPVTIGNEMRDGDGLLLKHYTVGDSLIAKAADNWQSNKAGRLDFDAEQWENWNAVE